MTSHSYSVSEVEDKLNMRGDFVIEKIMTRLAMFRTFLKFNNSL